MRVMLLIVALASLGIQAAIFLQGWSGHTLFGFAEDAIVVVGLGVVEALIFIFWIACTVFEPRR